MQFSTTLGEYFIELLRCELHDKVACPKPQEISWNDIFEYAKSQSLSAMAYSAICKSGFDIEPELKNEWKTQCSKNLVKCFNQEHECERICNALSDAGIKNMPLKGSVIRSLFPAPELREMCDLDILIKPEEMERAHAMMLADGYSYIENHTTSHNREYHKLPYMNVEVHTYLVPQEGSLFSYYSDFWDRVLCTDNKLICRMTWNDCYIFLLAHAYKHFFLRGTGIRSVMDIYVMREKLKDVLDRVYIENELKQLEIFEFAEHFERLADCWFGEEESEIPQDLLYYHYRVLESGTYGDFNIMKTQALRHMQDGKSFQSAKRTMAVTKVFPSYKYMKTMYPCLRYLPFLLPLFWVVRWTATLLTKPKKISTYFGKLKNLSLSGDKAERG